jgi:hypothetical protein
VSRGLLRVVRGVAVIFLLMLLLASSVQAAAPASRSSTLYLHVLSIQDMPMTIEAPDAKWSQDVYYGLLANTLTCVGDNNGNLAGTGNEYHTAWGYASPGRVDYDHPSKHSGMPYTPPERGLWANLSFVRDAQPVVYWYVSTAFEAGPGGVSAAAPQPSPSLVVKVTLREGLKLAINYDDFSTKPLIAHGESRPATLLGPVAVGPSGEPAADVRPLGLVQGRWIYEVRVPLQVDARQVNGTAGVGLRLDMYVANPACNDPSTTGSIQPNTVAIHSSDGRRPRLEWQLEPTLHVERWKVLLHAEEGAVLIADNPRSALGPHDVAKLNMSLRGPYGPIALNLSTYEFQDYGPCGHDCGHTTSRSITAIAKPSDVAAAGLYEATLSFTNLQGTETWSDTMTWTVGPGPALPSPSAALLALGLMVFALLVRRQQAP